MKDITLRQLQCLAETVRTGSLAGAATTLHVTAPAVAAQLRLLEKSLGLTLIERGPGGQHPTEAGQLVADTAARVAAELKTTFASHYTRTISLSEALDPETIRAYNRKATGEKFLINPSL